MSILEQGFYFISAHQCSCGKVIFQSFLFAQPCLPASNIWSVWHPSPTGADIWCILQQVWSAQVGSMNPTGMFSC